MRCIIVCFLTAFLPCVSMADDVLTTDGLERGTVKGILKSKEGNFRLRLDNRSFELEDVIAVHFSRRRKRRRKAFLVRLVGGCRLYADSIRYDSDESLFYLKTGDFGDLKLNANMVRGIFVPKNIKESVFVEKALEGEPASDSIILSGGDKIEGTLTSFSTDVIGFDSPSLGGEVSIKVEEIAGVVLTLLVNKGAPKGEPQMALYTTSDNLLRGPLVSSDTDTVRIKTRAGEFSVKLKNIESFYTYSLRFDYLSDIEPKKVEETPLFDRFLYPYQKDRSLEKKSPISIRRRIYRKGLSVHSKTELFYSLDGKYRRFVALIGLDDEAKGKGNVDFIVIADGKRVYERKGVTGKDEPSLVKIELEGVKELVLVVDFGEELHILDRAVWADAALVK